MSKKKIQDFLGVIPEVQTVGLLKGWIKFEENLFYFQDMKLMEKSSSQRKKGLLPQYTPTF